MELHNRRGGNIIVIHTTKNCKWCNNKYTPSYPHQLYCSQQCSYYAKLEHTNNRVKRYRKKYRKVQTREQQKKIGTGNLGCHRNPDFQVELKKICAEFYFLRLK